MGNDITIADFTGSLYAQVALLESGSTNFEFVVGVEYYATVSRDDSSETLYHYVEFVQLGDLRFLYDNGKFFAVRRVGTDEVIALTFAYDSESVAEIDDLFNAVYKALEFFEEKYNDTISNLTNGML